MYIGLISDKFDAAVGHCSKSESATMSRLDRIQNWPELAQLSDCNAAALSQRCGVSVRTLERHFCEKMGQPPKHWLAAQRQRRATQLLNQRLLLKEVAFQLGYKYPAHFTRDFKSHWGCSPSSWAVSPIESQGRSQKKAKIAISPTRDRAVKLAGRVKSLVGSFIISLGYLCFMANQPLDFG